MKGNHARRQGEKRRNGSRQQGNCQQQAEILDWGKTGKGQYKHTQYDRAAGEYYRASCFLQGMLNDYPQRLVGMPVFPVVEPHKEVDGVVYAGPYGDRCENMVTT